MSFDQDLSVDNPPDRGDILFYIQIISKKGEINNKPVWELRAFAFAALRIRMTTHQSH
jgi:hypothetical protein